MVNSSWYEVFLINSDINPTLVIKPNKKMQLIVILTSSILITFSLLLVFLPPLGTIIGVLVLVGLFVFNIHIFTLRIQYTGTELCKTSFLFKNCFDLKIIDKITKMRVIGTVANVPMMVRSVEFGIKEQGTFSINFMMFQYQEIIDLISVINSSLENDQ